MDSSNSPRKQQRSQGASSKAPYKLIRELSPAQSGAQTSRSQNSQQPQRSQSRFKNPPSFLSSQSRRAKDQLSQPASYSLEPRYPHGQTQSQPSFSSQSQSQGAKDQFSQHDFQSPYFHNGNQYHGGPNSMLPAMPNMSVHAGYHAEDEMSRMRSEQSRSVPVPLSGSMRAAYGYNMHGLDPHDRPRSSFDVSDVDQRARNGYHYMHGLHLDDEPFGSSSGPSDDVDLIVPRRPPVGQIFAANRERQSTQSQHNSQGVHRQGPRTTTSQYAKPRVAVRPAPENRGSVLLLHPALRTETASMHSQNHGQKRMLPGPSDAHMSNKKARMQPLDPSSEDFGITQTKISTANDTGNKTGSSSEPSVKRSAAPVKETNINAQVLSRDVTTAATQTEEQEEKASSKTETRVPPETLLSMNVTELITSRLQAGTGTLKDLQEDVLCRMIVGHTDMYEGVMKMMSK